MASGDCRKLIRGAERIAHMTNPTRCVSSDTPQALKERLCVGASLLDLERVQLGQHLIGNPGLLCRPRLS